MRNKKAIGIVFAVIIAISLFTVAIPGIASESSNTIVTVDTSSASKAKRILQIENVKSNLTDAQKKLSTDLLQLVDSSFLPPGQNREVLEMQMKNLGQFRPASSVSPKPDGSVADDLVYVYVYLKPPVGTRTIEPYVWEVTDRDEKNHLAVAWVGVKDLETLASLEAVRTIRTVMPPLLMTGSVTTEGDAIHRTYEVRTTYSQDGSGVKVGIISDGVDHRTDAQSSGDLPASLTVLSNTLGGDEGTAMLEIVHDMVPGADLYFHDAGANTVAFNSAIDALVTAGCDVICDDIGWITEPFFEDGTVASHLTSVLTSNDIIYASSAGNAGNKYYQGDYYQLGAGTQHDFSRGGTTEYYLYLQMQAGGSVRIVLQWNDQFGSSENDYNLFLYNIDAGTTVAQSTATQDGDDGPLEFITYTVPGGTPTADYAIIVDKHSGVGKTLEVFIYPSLGAGVYANNIDPTDSIFGHKAVPNVIAVGAIAANDPGNDDIEFFSSQGPVTITYPSPVSRPKPDLCGIDGVTVTGAGGFSSPFYGTSAAAPHIAAITAQLWGADNTKTGDEIRTMLYDSAVDLGSAGYDNVFGYGRTDALDAIEAITPTPTPEKEWNQTFGGTNWDRAYAVQQTFDGGYIITGYTKSYGAGAHDYWLVKTDSSGNTQWDKIFGGYISDSANSVQQTADGGYIIAGYTHSYGAGGGDFWLVKTDSLGNKQWDKTFGGAHREEEANSVQQTTDGGYIIAGERYPFGSDYYDDFWLVKTDSIGNELWNKTFGGTGFDVANLVQQTADGGYILAGYTRSYGAGSADFWLVKTDSSGNEVWNKTFGGTGRDEANSVQQTADGGYILAGQTNSYGAGDYDFWLVKTDSSGNKQWDKTFGGTDGDKAYSVQQTTDGGYILAGYTASYGAGSCDFWLVKTDSFGNKQWDGTFGGTDSDVAKAVQQTSDGGYILAGYTYSYGAGSADFWLVKVKGEETTISIFDTGAGSYPSIMGTHKGEIKPSCNIAINKLYTYPCVGTGGHTKSIELYENGELIASGTWNGYQDDWHNITINPPGTLLAGHTYNYTIVTGSYPQIIHEPSKEVTGGIITCTEFTDANGKRYTNWIPAIRLE